MERKNYSRRRVKLRFRQTNRKRREIEKTNREFQSRLRMVRAENALLAGILSGIGDPLCVVDRGFRVSFQNEPSKAIIGNQQGRMCKEAFGNALDLCANCPMEGTFADGMKRTIEKQISNPKGFRHVEVTTTPLIIGQDKVVGGIKLVRDISERKQAEAQLARSQRFLSAVIQGINDPLAVFDMDSRIVHANEAWSRWVNRCPGDVLGNRCPDLHGGECSGCAVCVVEGTLHSLDPCATEKRVRQASGIDLWFQVFTYPILGDHGAVTHVLEYGRDITDRKRTERDRAATIQKLAHLSRTDVLTGLNNRRVLMERLDHEMARSDRSGTELSIVLCDIDRFKYINDTLGHGVGDEILGNVGELLKNAVRKTDCVGRYGGDEFLLILPDTGLTGAVELAEQIQRAIKARTFRVGETLDVGITFSLGVASPPARSWSASRLVKAADDALYDAKRAGRDRVCRCAATSGSR